MHQLNQSRDPARAQGQWLQGLEHRFPVGVRPEGPDREQVHITNMFVYVPIVSTGWDGGNQAVSDWLGANCMPCAKLIINKYQIKPNPKPELPVSVLSRFEVCKCNAQVQEAVKL